MHQKRTQHEETDLIPHRILRALTGLALLAAATLASAQDFPNRALRVIVPFPAGGSAELVARAWAQRSQLGQPIVIENLPGASGAIGYSRVAKAAPDGYTLTIGLTGTFAVAPNLNPKIGYDPLKEFTPIAMIARLPIVLVTGPNTPYKGVAELIAAARANPGKLNYASVSPGTTSHILGEMLKAATGTNIVHIPYKGGAPANVAIIGGEVQLLFSSLPDALTFISSGRMRALGMAAARRAAALPDVPTLTELGLPFDTPIWYGMFAPAGIPAAIGLRLASDMVRVNGLDEMRQYLASLGAEPSNLNPDGFRELVTNDHARYGKVIRDANIKVD